MSFSNLKLVELIQKTLAAEGYEIPTPIQRQAIPHILEGHDVLGCAQTGTGKTAAFALPILQRLAAKPTAHGAQRHVRCLILCPTRELASQIGQSFHTYGQGLGLRHTTIFGGVNQRPQAIALRNGVDIVVATPGRLLDLLQQRLANLQHVEVLVLDEADRMLDMGFIHDIRKIIAVLPAKRQNLLFSATMPNEIRRLAETILKDPVSVQVAPVAATADRIDQSLYYVAKNDKVALLAKLFNELPMSRALVFTRTKHGADRVVKHLNNFGIRAEAIHGNKSQNARERALANFKAQKTPILVATDIASRGIDIDDISHVVNYDLTHEPETYVHRIGRTARAGAAGCAVSFCDHDEIGSLKAIERLIRISIPVKSGPLPRGGKSTAEPQRRHESRSHDARSHEPRSHEPRSHEHRSRDDRQQAQPEHRAHQPKDEPRSHQPRAEQRSPAQSEPRSHQPRAEHRDHAHSEPRNHQPKPGYRDHAQAEHQHHPKLDHKPQSEHRKPHPKSDYRNQPKPDQRYQPNPTHRHEQQAEHRHPASPKHRPAGRNPAHRPGAGIARPGGWRPAPHRNRPAFAAR